MAHCIADDVRLVIDTKLSDPQIDRLIAMADKEIDGRGLSGFIAVMTVSVLLTAQLIHLRMPSSKALAEYQDRVEEPFQWRLEAERVITGVSGVIRG